MTWGQNLASTPQGQAESPPWIFMQKCRLLSLSAHFAHHAYYGMKLGSVIRKQSYFSRVGITIDSKGFFIFTMESTQRTPQWELENFPFLPPYLIHPMDPSVLLHQLSPHWCLCFTLEGQHKSLWFWVNLEEAPGPPDGPEWPIFKTTLSSC